MSRDLEPCPFCGNARTGIGRGPEAGAPFVYCLAYDRHKRCGCGSQGPFGNTIDEAIAAWNKRPAPKAVLTEADAQKIDEYWPLVGAHRRAVREVGRLRAALSDKEREAKGLRAVIREAPKWVAVRKDFENSFIDTDYARQLLALADKLSPPQPAPSATEKPEPCFRDAAGWCSTHTQDSSRCPK